MTKLRKIILIPALVIVSISGFFSCGVDRWPEYAHMTALDTWMYDIMQQNYLWYQDLPSYDDANLFLEPAQFLSKVKSKNDSYSFVDSVMETPLPSYGFDYSLVRNPDIDTDYLCHSRFSGRGRTETGRLDCESRHLLYQQEI